MPNELLYQIFIKLFVVIDPFAVLPMFIMLTRNDTPVGKRNTALKACSIAAGVLVVFAVLGDKLFHMLGISQPALNIAGGGLLLLAAIEMVVAKDSGFHSTTADESKEAFKRDDISVFPLAIPLIAGPGALTTVVMVAHQAEEINIFAQAQVIFVLFLVLGITYAVLYMGDSVMRLLGVTGTNVLTRVFGIILAALAVQIMINGVSGFIQHL
ncbi:MAG: MarC family protein [Alphaproteobacteria bacterium]